MKTAIEIILALIALYSGYSWLTWVVAHYRGRLTRYSFHDVQFSMVGSGISCILALGFLGVML